MGLLDVWKSFKIGLAVLIQYRRVTDSQPATQPRRRSRYALCISASRSKKRLLFCWKWRESWATPLFLGNRQRREFNRFVEFASSEAIFWVSDVVATRFLRQISTHYCRAIRLESTVSTNEVKFFSCDIEKVNYRHFIVISRWKTRYRRGERFVSILRWMSTFWRDSRDRKWNSCRRK